jgi:hypothetical protein
MLQKKTENARLRRAQSSRSGECARGDSIFTGYWEIQFFLILKGARKHYNESEEVGFGSDRNAHLLFSVSGSV